jgi:hypothetical protein
MSAKIVSATVWEDATAVMLARLLGADGDEVVQADISSIACKVFDSSGVQIVAPSIVVSSVIYETLQTGSEWTVDSLGYNFRHALPTTAFPTGGETYIVEYVFTAADGSVFPVVYKAKALGLYSS